MATRYAAANGNWSALSTWDGGASLPGPSDDVYADGKTVTVDQNVTVNTLRSTNRGGGTVGGEFQPAAGITITLNETGALGGIVAGGSNTNSGTINAAHNSGTVTIIGKIVPPGGTVGQKAILFSGNGTLNVTASSDVVGPAGGAPNVIGVTGAGTLNAAGNFVGGPGYISYGTIYITGTPTVAITGNVTGSVGPAVWCSAAASITVTGTATASSGSPAIVNTSVSSTLKLSGPLINNGKTLAVQSTVLQLGSASTYWLIRDYNLNARNLYTADTIGGNPAIANVRHGTVYGPSNELTGTCHVPGAASVLSGVPVDATVGTAALAAADIRAALGMSSANLDTQLSAIPTAAAIRTEIDANSTKLDIAVSTRLAPAGTLATVTNLTNAPDVPTETEIAAAVWSYVTRTITSGGITAQQVWEYVSALLPDGAEALLAGIAARLAEQVPTGPVIVVPAPGAGQTTAWVMCADEAGAAMAGVEIYVQIASTTAAGAYSMATQILLSDADGLAAGPIPRGTEHRFRVRRGTSGAWVPFAGVDATTLALPAIIGAP